MIAPRFLIFLTAAMICRSCGFAQEGGSPIKVTTTLHEDGTKTVTTSDPDSGTSEAATYDGANKLRQRVVYSLDDQNQPVNGILYDPKGRAVFKSVYKRDASNRIAEQFDYTPNDKLVRRLVFQYGANNRVSNIRTFDANGVEQVSGKAVTDKARKAARQR